MSFSNSVSNRADVLAEACSQFPDLGPVTKEALLEWVRAEIGDPDYLDGFRPYGTIQTKASPLKSLFHVFASNTPLAALQSLTRGILVGVPRHFGKLPTGGLPEVEAFCQALPKELRDTIDLGDVVDSRQIRQAEGVLVFGGEQALEHFRPLRRPGQVWLEFGPKFSLALVEGDSEGSWRRAAQDIGRFNQKGCLSVQVIYVDEKACGSIHDYATGLSQSMMEFEESHPRGNISLAEQSEINQLRGSYRFRAANDPRISLLTSPESTAWTIIAEEDSAFSFSCLNRLVFVKPLPTDLVVALGPAKAELSTVALWPFSLEAGKRWAHLEAHRYTALGDSQNPSLFWHHDGRQTLAPLLKWIDIEGREN